jgi:shikimate 5-dehydrogenase
VYALSYPGYDEITVLYREPQDDKTRALERQAATSGRFTVSTYHTVEVCIAAADVVCTMTPAGMRGNAVAAFDLARIAELDPRGKWFFDAVFNPIDTSFLQTSERNGAVVVDGLWMMIYHGVPAFSKWTGIALQLRARQLGAVDMHERLSDAAHMSQGQHRKTMTKRQNPTGMTRNRRPHQNCAQRRLRRGTAVTARYLPWRAH